MSETPRARSAADRGAIDDPSIPVLSDRIYLPALELDIALPTQAPGSGPGRPTAASLRPAGGEVDILGDTTGATITAAALIDAARRELAAKAEPPVAETPAVADEEPAIETELDADLAAELDADLEALLQAERDLAGDAVGHAAPAPAGEPPEAPAAAFEAVDFDTTISLPPEDGPAAVATPADGAVEFDITISLPPPEPVAAPSPAGEAVEFDLGAARGVPQTGRDEAPVAPAKEAIETPAKDDLQALDLQAEALRHAVLAGVAQRLPERIDATVRDLMQPAIDDAIARLGEEAQVALRITLQELVEQILREELARRR